MVALAVSNRAPVHFVKDQGVYLMSFAPTGPNDNRVVYARGFDPERNDFDEWYDSARAICGGDDFGEQLATDFLIRAVARGASMLRIKLTSADMTLEAE